MEKLKIICHISIGKNIDEWDKICELAKHKGWEFIVHYCENRQELEYSIYTAGAKSVVLLQERPENGKVYQAWEIAALRDIRKIPIVLILNRQHYGTEYMAVLYAAGILDAVYDDDRMSAEEIIERLLVQRQRKECREYYGIQSLNEVTTALDIIAQDALERYIRYLSSGVDTEDVQRRYQEVRNKLSEVENFYLVSKLPDYILTEIKGDASFSDTLQKKREGNIFMSRFITDKFKNRRT